RAMIVKQRVISTFTDRELGPDRLQRKVELFKEHLDFKPSAILVDGFDWAAHTVAENAAILGAFKSYAKMNGAELWMTAQTHREATGQHPTRLTPPCDAYDQLIDVALFLEPHHEVVKLRLLKDH